MRNVLTVFIASPSDLSEERKAAFSIVGEINETLKSIDWSIDLLGWEDTLPGYGRPQELINCDVQRCDLFIGLLWRRWGTPPSHDRKYTSGFEEEYMTAIGRREVSFSPDIWMFFKTVDPVQVADAGAQLQQVIAFRESLTASRAVLFKEFETAESWEKMIRTSLYKYVLNIAGAQSSTPEGPSVRAQPRSEALPDAQDGSSTPAGHQIEVIAHSLAPSFDSGDIAAIASSLGTAQELAFLGVRTYLLSATLIEESGTSLTPLGVHEINTLYVYRDRLQPTQKEFQLLFKNIIADNSDVKPGWYVFRSEQRETIESRLYYTCLFENDSAARKKCFDILRRTHLSLFAAVRSDIVIGELQSLPTDLHADAWAYLVDIVSSEEVELLKAANTDSWLSRRVEWLRDWVGEERYFDRFLSSNPDPLLITIHQKERLISEVQILSDASLNILKTWPVADVRGATLRELQRRGVALTEEERADSVEYSRLLLKTIARSSATSERPETGEERYARLCKEDVTAPMSQFGWYSVDNAWRYRIHVERGLIARDVVRRDISEGFRRVRRESDERLAGLFGAETSAQMRADFAQFDKTMSELHTEQAFLALSHKPTPDDVLLARQFITTDRYETAAIRIVLQGGDASDVEALIEIARSRSGEDRTLALEGIKRLSSDHIRVAKELLVTSGNREVQRLGLFFVRQSPDSVAIPLLAELLSHGDDVLRAASISELESRVDYEGLVDMLAAYTNRPSYYYNVVTWLDRLLYAPEPLRSYYGEELDRRIEDLKTKEGTMHSGRKAF
jgi:hypothetical protein